MTMLRAFWVLCDGCEAQEPPDAGETESWWARASAKDLGWHRSAKKDLCPECWEAGVR